MKPIIWLLAFLLLSFNAWSQQFTVSGTIKDDSGQPVPFATVMIQNTTKGTSANAEGHYAFKVAQGNYFLAFKAVGYKQEIRPVAVNGNTVINVNLGVASYELNNVVVRPGAEDPAYNIIRNAIAWRKGYLNEVKSYRCEVYLKGLQRMLAAPKKFMGQDITELGKQLGLDSNRRGIFYLSESESRLSYLRPDLYHEEMISSKVSGSNRAFSFNRASELQINFYENFMDWSEISNRPLVSPIADNAFSFYDYKWLGAIEENGETINKIRLIPKHSYDPAFSGLIYITENTWRIHSFDVQITKSANLKLVDTLKISEQYVQVSKKVWMPASLRFDFTGGLFGFKIGGYFISLYHNYELNPSLNKKDFAELVKISKGVNKKDSTYWQQQRPVPLTKEEQTDYDKKAVLAVKRESKSYLDSLDRLGNRITPNKILLSGITISNRYDKQYLHFAPVLPSLLYNTIEGFAINYGVTYYKQIDTVTNKYLSLGAKARYGFSNHLANGSVHGNVPIKSYNLGFNVGADMADMNSTDPFSTFSNTYSSLISRKNRQKLYEKKFADLSLSRRIAGGWLGSISGEYADRQWYPNSSYFSFFNRGAHYTSNNPFQPDEEIPLFPHTQSLKINVRTSYDFSNRYVTYPSGRYYLPSNYPKIEFSYTKGIKNILGSDVDYDLLTVSISKADLSLGLYGKSSFYIGAGKFLNAKQLYYPDFIHFLGNESYGYQMALNRFLFLPIYNYSTPDKYFEGHFEHNFSGYFLNHVPLIRKFKLQEILNFNYLTTPELRNYVEVAGGVQYFGTRVMYGWAFTNNHILSNIRIGITIP